MLILDDDAGVRRTVALMARRLGLAVETSSTLKEFEAILDVFDPDFLLIDLMMPDADGIDVIARTRSDRMAAIYVMSGADKRTCDASQHVLRSTNAHIAGFLHKPFSVSELAKALSQPQSVAAEGTAGVTAECQIEHLSLEEFGKLATAGKVIPYFQPIFDARARVLKGFEGLLRLDGQSRDEFSNNYIDYLKNSGILSRLLSDVVIDQSLRFIASLGARSDLSISINVFGIDAVADGFRERLIERCAAYEVAPHRVILELSEATLCEFDGADMRKITQLRLAGFGLSIDDFGTQNSSLRRLASLPFSELKIDKSFCFALPGSEPVAAIIEACLGIARKLDMKVTAEGVESCEVADMLTNTGCDALQGYYFGKAMPHAQAAEWIRRGCPLPGHAYLDDATGSLLTGSAEPRRTRTGLS